VPAARGRGRRFPGDGVVDGERLLVTLLDGVEVRCGVSVEGFRPRQGHAEVTTRAGVVRGRVLVNAAGAWAGVLGGLPLVPRKRHVFRAPTPPTLAGAPILWDVEHGLYLRPEGATVLACACDDMPGEPGDNAVRPGARGALEEKLARLQPAVGRLDLDGGWAGQRTFAPDDRPVVGWDSRMRGLFWLGGLGGWGVTVAPVLGELAADWLLAGPDGPTPTLLAPFHPSRLA
jgi:D-arginine dehydrogenase